LYSKKVTFGAGGGSPEERSVPTGSEQAEPIFIRKHLKPWAPQSPRFFFASKNCHDGCHNPL